MEYGQGVVVSWVGWWGGGEEGGGKGGGEEGGLQSDRSG